MYNLINLLFRMTAFGPMDSLSNFVCINFWINNKND